MHTLLPFLLALVAAVVLLEMLATKLRIAYPIVLVLAGLALGFVPGLPRVRVDPELIFFLFLPPLLFEAAWNISFKEMRRWWRIIGSFALLVVFFTALSVAVVTSYAIPGFTLALGFLLGGIVSPPDAVSTGAITRFVRIPQSTSAILQGESLLNDASSLIIFRFALVTVGTGQFIWQEASLDFLWMVSGGVGIGLLLGWLFVQGHKRLPTDAPSDIALTIIEPYFMYWAAEQLHSSGVLAVVSGGLFMANRRLLFLNSTSRVRGYSVWESFVFILNGLVFLIIGLELPEIVDGLRADGIPLSSAIYYGLLVTGILILARIISSYAAMVTTLIFRPGVAPRGRSPKQRWLLPLLLGWTGMRGVVSLAAALAIPLTLADGTEFPHRSLILFITFVVILVTLVVQGLTLPAIIRRSGLFDIVSPEDPQDTALRRIRQELHEHALSFLRERVQPEQPEHESLRQLITHWENKVNTGSFDPKNEHTKEVIFAMLESQRQHLVRVNRDPSINEEIVRQELYLIDLEEERLRMKL
ncbi:MAG TPA: Na+/H+ antiporter [Flavobacteriales bacterium]|nr:Na+/H+ antiporter [Flavobacteriales bacterium]